MPSIHIPEAAWAQLLVQEDGDTDEARARVKRAVRREVKNDE